jgi:predicted secreted protein
MATSGVLNGTDFRIWVSGEAIGYSTSCSLSMSAELRETIHKDNPGSGWRTFSIGQKSATITVDAFYNTDANSVYSARKDPDDVAALFINETPFQWQFRAASGDDMYSGSGYVTEMSIDSPVEDNATYSLTIEVNGAVAIGNY